MYNIELKPFAQTGVPALFSFHSALIKFWRSFASKNTFKRVPISPYVLQIGLGDLTYMNSNPQASAIDNDEKIVDTLRSQGFIRVKHLDFNTLFPQEESLPQEESVKAVSHIPFPDEEFETVFILDTLEFFDFKELKIFFEDIARVLKKNGQLIIFTANKKGFDMGRRQRNLQFKTMIDETMVKNLTSSLFWYVENYTTPVASDLARLSPCCREVFVLNKL